MLHVGVHVEPSASVEVQPGPGAPFAIGPLGSHGTRAVHSFGGPAVDSVSSRRSKAASHALACVNMSPYTVNDAVFQPVMSWLKRPGAIEHLKHGRDQRGIPRSDVLIERAGLKEHRLHIRDLCGIPRSDILVERIGLPEHRPHVFNIGNIPAAEVLVERACAG